MDDFYEIFALNEDDLLYARSEAEEIWTSICKDEIKIEQRCDLLFWIKGFSDQKSAEYPNPLTSFYNIYEPIANLKLLANEISQSEWGDKSLIVDDEDIVVAHYNGASNKEQHYLRHKDSYIRDENNRIHGQRLRKLSLVVFLSDNVADGEVDSFETMDDLD